MSNIFQEEIVRLHRFLEAWLKGEVPKGDGRPERLAKALSNDFLVIHPNGTRGSKADVVGAFASAYGSKPPEYALEIGHIETRMIADELCLATYEERHRGEPGRARIATAILQQRSMEEGIEWLLLHETPAPHLETTQSST
jgi:hypothetical protein